MKNKAKAGKVELAKSPSSPKPEANKSLALSRFQSELEILKQTVQHHEQLIADLQGMIALKRKPASNSKVQIKDKATGKVYPSKNNCYQLLLKSGELKELVDKGTFGPNPEKNNFGWFALVRAWPDRFEEVKAKSGEAKLEEADAKKSSSMPENK
jgi:hypothetical protein